jgi:hypothetical protein
MKNLLFLLLLLVSGAMCAQEFTISPEGDGFRLRSFTVLDNAEGVPDTANYNSVFLADTTAAVNHILRLWQLNRRLQYRALAKQWEANYQGANATLEGFLTDFSFDVDSVYTVRNFRQIFPDTVTITVPLEEVPAGELADYTNDTITPPSSITFDAYPFLQANGNVQLRHVETAGRWRVVLNGPDGFELRRFLGETTEFGAVTTTDRRRVYRSEQGLVRRGSSSRVVIRYNTDTPIDFN